MVVLVGVLSLGVRQLMLGSAAPFWWLSTCPSAQSVACEIRATNLVLMVSVLKQWDLKWFC